MAQDQQLVKIAEGREAEVFAWGDGAVLKLFRDDSWQGSLRSEMAAMNALQASNRMAPRASEEVRVRDRPGLVMERIDGPDYLTLIGKDPRKLFGAGRVLGIAHARMHKTRAPDELPSLKERLARRIEEAASEAPRYRHLSAFALDVLASLPDGDRLLHGDFHPGNVLVTRAGPVVIDWPNASRGDPTADVARTLLLLSKGQLPPGTPRIIALMQRGARVWLRREYLVGYRSIHAADDDLLARWQIPVAANRITEGIEAELPALLALLERAYARR